MGLAMMDDGMEPALVLVVGPMRCTADMTLFVSARDSPRCS